MGLRFPSWREVRTEYAINPIATVARAEYAVRRVFEACDFMKDASLEIEPSRSCVASLRDQIGAKVLRLGNSVFAVGAITIVQ